MLGTAGRLALADQLAGLDVEGLGELPHGDVAGVLIIPLEASDCRARDAREFGQHPLRQVLRLADLP